MKNIITLMNWYAAILEAEKIVEHVNPSKGWQLAYPFERREIKVRRKKSSLYFYFPRLFRTIQIRLGGVPNRKFEDFGGNCSHWTGTPEAEKTFGLYFASGEYYRSDDSGEEPVGLVTVVEKRVAREDHPNQFHRGCCEHGSVHEWTGEPLLAAAQWEGGSLTLWAKNAQVAEECLRQWVIGRIEEGEHFHRRVQNAEWIKAKVAEAAETTKNRWLMVPSISLKEEEEIRADLRGRKTLREIYCPEGVEHPRWRCWPNCFSKPIYSAGEEARRLRPGAVKLAAWSEAIGNAIGQLEEAGTASELLLKQLRRHRDRAAELSKELAADAETFGW